MGLDLDFLTQHETDEHEPIPEHFGNRYAFRHGFLSALIECKTTHFRTCGCPENEKHVYMCGELEPMRPVDFVEFRRILEVKKIFYIPECRDMYDFLKRNRNIFVSFSN